MKKRGRGSFFPKNHKGQVTIFIIIAIVIVVLGVLIFMFYPQISTTLGFGSQNPASFIQSCIEKDIKDAVSILSLQGGSLSPEHYILYNNEKIEYLCYTGEYYQTCIVQQPMLKEHIESEIKNEIQEEVDECFNSMKESYQKKGYNVNLKHGDMNVELSEKSIVTTFDYSLTLTKDDSETFDTFRVVLDNNLYELVSVANSILEWEATYGDSETTFFMNQYHNLKVEKKKQSDGTTVYILTDRDTENKFQFASRSVAWPPGYGAGK